MKETYKRIWEIPEKIRIANRIEFDHEDNEYVLRRDEWYINIPSDARILRRPENGTIVYIVFDFMVITLWVNVSPHITIYNPENRDFVGMA